MYAIVRKFWVLTLVILVASLVAVTVSAQSLTASDMLPKGRPTYELAGAVDLKVSDVKECPAEVSGTCYTARIRDGHGGFQRFWWENGSALWQDGYRVEPGVGMLTGIPPLWKGFVEGFTYRPTGSPPGEEVPESMPIAAPPTLSVPVTFPVTGTVVTDGRKANVRAGAGTSYSVTAQVDNGTVVTVTGITDGWYTIQVPEGYVSVDLIVLSGQVVVKEASSATTEETADASDLGAYGVTVLAGEPKFVSCNDGKAICWADWKNPVKVKLEVPQDGEYFLSGNSGETKSPVPVGTWYVTGLTLRVGGNGK